MMKPMDASQARTVLKISPFSRPPNSLFLIVLQIDYVSEMKFISFNNVLYSQRQREINQIMESYQAMFNARANMIIW